MVEAAVDTTPSNFARTAVQGTVWTYLSYLSGKGANFLSTIVLARLLVPEQFGLMGYCLLAVNYLDVLNTFGMDAALVARKDRVEQAANAAFIISAAMGIFLFGVAWAGAPLIAAFFNEDAVTDLFRMLALTLPLSALGMVPSAMVQRSLRFKAKVIPDVAFSVSKGVVTIILAVLGLGVWSLIWGQVVSTIIGVAALWLLARWRPTFVFERQVSREMLRFGMHITSVGLVGALRNNIDYLLVGRFLGAPALGFYLIAYRVPELVIRNMNFVVGKVAFPVLARLQSDPTQMRSIYFGYVRYIALFTFPAGLGLALISEPFVHVFYTATWDASVRPMQFIAIALAVASIGHVPGVLYKAINRPGILNVLSLIKVPLAAGIIWLVLPWGITGVAVGQIMIAMLSMLLDSGVISRIVGFGLQETGKALIPALMASTIMAAAVWSVASVFAPAGLPALAVLIVAGGIAYIAALAFVSRETLVRASLVVRGARGR